LSASLISNLFALQCEHGRNQGTLFLFTNITSAEGRADRIVAMGILRTSFVI